MEIALKPKVLMAARAISRKLPELELLKRVQNKLCDLRALRGDPFDPSTISASSPHFGVPRGRSRGHPEEARRMTTCLTTMDAKHTKEKRQKLSSHLCQTAGEISIIDFGGVADL